MAVILVWASLSSAVFGTFIGLAVAFTSLSVGAGVAGACVMVIVAVMVISHRMFRHQGSGGRRRASYTRPVRIRRREKPKGYGMFMFARNKFTHTCPANTGKDGSEL